VAPGGGREADEAEGGWPLTRACDFNVVREYSTSIKWEDTAALWHLEAGGGADEAEGGVDGAPEEPDRRSVHGEGGGKPRRACHTDALPVERGSRRGKGGRCICDGWAAMDWNELVARNARG
jgi:hypothetical protein